jgi:hypothetical protein
VVDITQDQDRANQEADEFQDTYEEDQDDLNDQINDLQHQLDEVQQTSYTYNEYHVYNEPAPAQYPIDANGYIEPSNFDYDYGNGNTNSDCNIHTE